MKSSFTSSILLLALVLSLNCGCAQESPGEETVTTADVSSETAADSESDREPYTIPELDLGGETFTILNPEKNYWDCYTTLDVEEETGEILDDAVFRRNVALEELFNFEFEIVEMEFYTDLPAELSNAIMSGDDVYDAAFTKPDQSFSVFTSGDAIYPIASHMALCRNMFDGAGEMLISFDSEHMPVFDDPPQSFYDVAEIVAKCFDRTNNFMLDINMLNDSGYNKHSAFMNDRAVIYFLEAIE